MLTLTFSWIYEAFFIIAYTNTSCGIAGSLIICCGITVVDCPVGGRGLEKWA